MSSYGYGWIITQDHIGRGEAVGVMGPQRVRYTAEEIKQSGEPFRLLDADGTLYYEGVYLGSDDETSFRPLDDYGMPAAGCTTIQFRGEDGSWADL